LWLFQPAEDLVKPKFTFDGKIQPFEPGTVLQSYKLLERREWLGKSYYLAESGPERRVIVESPAYFQQYWQQRVWAQVSPVMAQFGLAVPEAFFHVDYQGLVLNYTLFPESFWEQLNCSLQEQFWQTGLVPEAVLRQAYQWMSAVQKALAKVGWTNPSLIFPLLTWQADSASWGALEWEFCVPLDDELEYPCFYLGYHHAVPLFAVQDQNTNHRRSRSALYASLQAMLQGKQPGLWAPEPISSQSAGALLSSQMRDWLHSWPQNSASQWPALPSGPIYRNQAELKIYQQACQHFNQGLDQLQENQPEAAYHSFLQAREAYLSDPWAPLMLARLLRQTQRQDAAQQMLMEALRLLPLAVLQVEKAMSALENKEFQVAEEALFQALQRCPQYDEAWYLRGVSAHQQRQLPEAEKYLRQACRLRPLNNRYKQALSTVLEDMGLPEEASSLQKYALGDQLKVSLDLGAEKTLPPAAPSPLPQTLGNYLIEKWESASAENSHATGQNALAKGPDGSLVRLRVFDASQPLQVKRYAHLKSKLAALRHPHLLPLYGTEESDSHSFLVFPYLPVPSWEAQLKQGQILEPQAVLLASAQLEQAIRALQRHHPPLVHGDIKPANVLWHDGHQHALLVDYDSLVPSGEKSSFSIFTHSYAPIEIRRDATPDLTSDFYSLALTLLQTASGLFPELCADWKTRDFSKYRQYLTHLPESWVDSLLAWSRWDPERRRLYPLPALPDKLPAAPQKLKELASLVARLATCETSETAQSLAASLLNLEANSVTSLHVAFHYLRLGLLEAALQQARNSLRGDPTQVSALWIQADAYERLHKPLKALHVLQKSLDIDPDQAETYRRLVRIYTAMGKLELAWAAVEHLVRCLPNQVESHLQKLRLMVYLEMHNQATELAQLMLKKTLPERHRQEIEGHLKQLQAQRKGHLSQPAKVTLFQRPVRKRQPDAG